MAKVILKDIYKKFSDAAVAVSNLSLEIGDGEFFVLAGPSGCGKSTVLRMIAGLEEATSGSIYIGERLVNKVAPKDRDIAVVFQNYALYPHMTVFENMAFGLSLYNCPKDEIARRVEEAARTLDITGLLGNKPKSLTPAQLHRVVLGRAVVRAPQVFLLDEPLSGLDAKLAGQMRGEVKKLQRDLKATFLYVTPDQGEAMELGDRIAVMKDGALQQVGGPRELFEKPGNRFVAGFIGAPQMNFIDAEVVGKGGGFRLEFGAAERRVSLPVPAKYKDALAGRAGGEVLLGIRPEDVHIDKKFLEKAKSIFTAGVEYEKGGGGSTMLLSLDGPQVTAPVGAEKPRAGTEVKAAFDTGKIYLFDKATEKSLLS